MIRKSDSADKIDDKDIVRAEYRSAAQRAMIRLLLQHPVVTTDAVQSAVPVPRGVHASNLGLAIYGLSRDGLIRMAGVAQTTRAAGTGRLIREWALVDAAAAQAWLASSGNAESLVSNA